MDWAGKAFARQLLPPMAAAAAAAAAQTAVEEVVILESSPQLPLCRRVAKMWSSSAPSGTAGAGRRVRPVLLPRSGGAVAAAVATACASRLASQGVLPPCMGGLAEALARGGAASSLRAVWLGFDAAKPWRARPWVERPGSQVLPGVSNLGGPFWLRFSYKVSLFLSRNIEGGKVWTGGAARFT
jgi:hypothetical protein